MSSLRWAARLISSWLYPDRPSYLIYFVTTRCNARCRMCFYWREMESSPLEDELKPEETEKIARHLPRLVQLTLSGGEPFLREDLFELVRPLIEKARPLILSIPSNGILTESIIRAARQICSSYPGLRLNLELSLDGIGDLHDQIRGKKGAYENLLASWKALKEVQKKFKNLRLGILTVLSAFNQERIFELLKFVKSDLQPDRMEVMLARGETREASAKNVSIEKFREVSEWLEKEAGKPEGFLDRLREELAKEKRKLIIETVSKNRMILPCLAGIKLIVIEPDGWVRPCEMLSLIYPTPQPALGLKDLRLGNLREENYNLLELLQNGPAKKVKNFIQAGQCHCSYECASLANLVFRPGQAARIFWKAGF